MAFYNDEVDANFEAFQKQLPMALAKHRGEYALLHNCSIINYFSDALTAMKEGFSRFGEGHYSVQEVTNECDSLGFYSYAGSPGRA